MSEEVAVLIVLFEGEVDESAVGVFDDLPGVDVACGGTADPVATRGDGGLPAH
jgi:hypothetical protein